MSVNRGKRLFLRLLRIILDYLANLMGLIYPSKQNYLPPIQKRLLLDSATSLAQQIKSGKLKSEDVIRAYIERCYAVQPHINAIIQDNFENAINEAKQVDIRVQQELEGNGPIDESMSIHSQPFLGLPFTTKDSMAVKDMYWTAGLWARRGITAPKDSDVIDLMRKSGAIFLAMTNVPELVMWWDSYNTVYGRTYNPYDKSRICGGSSGGEGALISAAGSLIGVGADIGGSIRMPCFFNGIFGHKTTPGIVPTKGIHPDASPKRQPLLSIGPMTRYACDLKPMLKVMSGSNASKLDLDKAVDLTKLKFYYMENDDNPFHTPVQSDISEAIHKVIGYFNRKGSFSKKVYFKQFKYGLELWLCAMNDPSVPNTAQQLTNLKSEINPFKEIFKSIFGLSNHTFCGSALCLSELLLKTIDKKQFNEMRETLTQDLHKLLGNDGILVFPVHPEEAVKHNQTLLKVSNVSYTQLFNPLNVAITSVPLGLSKNGLPIGLQIIASPLNDRLTIAVAEELEREFGGWVSPSDIQC